jgi:hypothetical protein
MATKSVELAGNVLEPISILFVRKYSVEFHYSELLYKWTEYLHSIGILYQRRFCLILNVTSPIAKGAL